AAGISAGPIFQPPNPREIQTESQGEAVTVDFTQCASVRRELRLINLALLSYETGNIATGILSGLIVNYPEVIRTLLQRLGPSSKDGAAAQGLQPPVHPAGPRCL